MFKKEANPNTKRQELLKSAGYLLCSFKGPANCNHIEESTNQTSHDFRSQLNLKTLKYGGHFFSNRTKIV